MEKKLNYSNEFFKTVLDSINDSISIISIDDFKILDCNDVFLKGLGIKEKKEVIGKTCYELTHHRSEPCKPPDNPCPITDQLKTGKTVTYEHVHYGSGNKKVNVEVTAHPIIDEDGRVTRAVHVTRDITERKMIEEEWFHTFNSISDLVSVHDLEHRVVKANKALAEFLGMSQEELIGKHCYEIFHEMDRPIDHCPQNRVMETRKPATEEVYDQKTGTYLLISVSPIFDENGEIKSVVHYAKDITDMKKMEKEHKAIFRSVRDAIIAVDKELNIIEVNEAAKTICGLSHDKVIGKPFSAVVNKCNFNCGDILMETIQKKDTVEANRIECIKDNQRHIVSISTYPFLDNRDIFSGGVMVVKDETKVDELESYLRERKSFYSLIGKSGKMQEIYNLIETLSDVDSTVLITGESGTGKELVAEVIHYRGVRKDKPIVKVNCSALSENILESELFGHVRGAFTGAIMDKIGRFQKAHSGTIFLDEIGDISPGLQSKLLRVLENMEFEMVGDSTPIKVDVRVIAATNQDIHKKLLNGKFREDLFYRLKVVEMYIPPLRERREDVPLLVDHFIRHFNKKFNKGINSITNDVQRIFMDYQWPGNIRELIHTVEHAFIKCNQSIITTDDLPLEFKRHKPLPISLKEREENEYKAIRNALEKANWNKTLAAKLLGIDRRTVYRKIEKHGLTHKEM